MTVIERKRADSSAGRHTLTDGAAQRNRFHTHAATEHASTHSLTHSLVHTSTQTLLGAQRHTQASWWRHDIRLDQGGKVQLNTQTVYTCMHWAQEHREAHTHLSTEDLSLKL